MNNCDEGSERGSGDDINCDMLPGCQRGVANTAAPCHIDELPSSPRLHRAQDAVKPPAGEYRESHVQRREGIARMIDRLEKLK